MKNIILISLTLLLISCNKCPKCPEPPACPEILIDTNLIIAEFKVKWEREARDIWNTAKYNAFAAIDSMKEITMLEVYNLNKAAEYQATKRIIAMIDSFRDTRIHDNLIIYQDSISDIDFIGFDSTTNIPFIRFKPTINAE